MNESIIESLSEKNDNKTSPERSIEKLLSENGINSNVEFTLFLGSHGTKEDADNFSETLAESDILIPEIVGQSDDLIAALEDVSCGKRDEDEVAEQFGFFDNQFNRRLLSMLSNQKKAIVHIDLEKGDELLGEITQTFSIENILDIPNASEASEKFAKILAKNASLQKQREEVITLRLPKKILGCIKNHPELTVKEKIKIVMFLGAMHGTIRNDLEEIISTEVTKLSSPVLVYGYGHEIYKRSQYDKEITHDLKMQSLLELLFSRLDLPSFSGSSDKFLLMRKIVPHFTIEEIGNIWDRVYGKKKDEMKFILKNALIEKGIILPKTKEEFDKFTS